MFVDNVNDKLERFNIMVDFKKILKNAGKNWATAKKRAAETESGFTEYPDGKYEAQLTGAKLGVSEGGRNQIAFAWKFVDGDFEGKTKTAYQGIDTEDNLYFLARDLERLGYELPDDLTDLPDILKDLEKSKPVASINLKSKGDFQNVYIRKVYTESDEDDEDEEEDDDAAAEAEADDDAAEDEEEETDDDAAEEEESDEEESDEEEEEADDEEADDEEEEEADEEAEDDAEEVDIEVGMRVQAETIKGREPGEIAEILEKEEKVRVKLDSGRTVKLGIDKIEIEAEEEAPAPKPTKTQKTAAPAPKKKAAPAPAPAKKKVTAAPAKKTVPGKKKKSKR
jgi:hypothetical protein